MLHEPTPSALPGHWTLVQFPYTPGAAAWRLTGGRGYVRTAGILRDGWRVEPGCGGHDKRVRYPFRFVMADDLASRIKGYYGCRRVPEQDDFGRQRVRMFIEQKQFDCPPIGERVEQER
jgi:hypothetical protein